MKKGRLIGKILGIALTFVLVGAVLPLGALSNHSQVEASPGTIYVPDDYLTIQAAVNAANPGDTIIVKDGTYTENVNVNKDHLTIRSEHGATSTIVQTANPTSPAQVFAVWADYVTLSGFTVRKARYDISSIAVGSSYCCIENNDAQGIFLGSAKYNIVRKNRSSNSWAGIYQENASGNTLYMNDLVGNGANAVRIGSSTGSWHSPEETTYTYNGNTYTGYLGNYWSDYTGSDADADGIGDTPYQMGTEADNYPLMEPFENYGIGLMGKIAFVHDVYPGNSEIYVMNADGTNQIQLTDSPQNDYHPAWSRDGTKIAFCSPRDGNWEIYAMHSDGSNQTRLTNNPADDANPTWSPDGTMIAFNSQRDGDWEIYVMNASGGGEERVTYNSASDEEPAWSPDGNRIAFVSNRDGNYEIYVMNADGSNQTRLTTNPAWDYGPTWSPDSTKIAFTSLRDSNREIYAMNADGSGQTRLTENAVSDFSPDWSPGSQPPPECIATAAGTGTACFTTSNGTIEHLTAVSTPPSAPAGIMFPHGMFTFKITGLSDEEELTLTVELPDPVPPGTKWWKYHNNTWSPMDIGDDDGDNLITVALKDGRTPDDEDTIPGQITDQGGPGNPGSVGWETYPTSKARVLLPWIALLAALIAGATLLALRRRRSRGHCSLT